VQFLGQAEVGFFVVILLVSMLARWFEAIQVVIAKNWTYGDEPQQRRTLLWALPVVLILHSGPWAATAFAFLLWHLLHGPENLLGFGSGLTAGAVFMAMLITSASVRARRRGRIPANAA
jgi:hypothetical protein